MSSKYFDEQKWTKALRRSSKGFIVLTTYAMVSKKRDALSATKKTLILEQMKQVQWGLCLLDEVQVVPANTF
jgi:superfamily II DNA or RNA helicase